MSNGRTRRSIHLTHHPTLGTDLDVFELDTAASLGAATGVRSSHSDSESVAHSAPRAHSESALPIRIGGVRSAHAPISMLYQDSESVHPDGGGAPPRARARATCRGHPQF